MTQIVFTTLSNLVLDELQFPGQPTLTDVIGGPGSYAVLGARLLRPLPLAQSIGWLVYVGLDFPPSLESELASWGMTLSFLRDKTARTARGQLRYEDDAFGIAHFTEISPALRLSPHNFTSSPLLGSSFVHLLGPPEFVEAQVPLLHSLRHQAGISKHAKVIWEPEPRSCKPTNRARILEAARLVDLVSPNHLELGCIFGYSGDCKEGGDAHRERLEDWARIILDSGVNVKGGDGAVVVRAAEHGCFVVERDKKAVWVPSYYAPLSQEKTLGDQDGRRVIDPTGAGNAFLGGFAVGLAETESLVEALMYGAVSASLVVEQVGFPQRDVRGGVGNEVWNGADVRERLKTFVERVRSQLSEE